jgi:3-oxoacyl-[acyl-carrier protein] reductase
MGSYRHENKIALVTGASRGIGRAIALELAKSGALVYGTATSEAGAEQITQYFQENQLMGKGLVLDLKNAADSINELVTQLSSNEQFPDILVANAGIAKDNLLLRMKNEEWEDVLNINLNSIFPLAKTFIKPMLKKRWGRIILVSSVSGVMGNVGQTNYAAAKAGLIGFGKSLALELASRNITVNMVAPGFIATDMLKEFSEEQSAEINKSIPLGEMGEPEDVAALVNFLASQAARYIVGETIQINGGLYLQ